MSWRVNVVNNSLEVSGKCIEELWDYNKKANLEIWDSKEDMVEDGVLYFNEDDMEWIDYIANYKKIIDILKENKAKGEVCFSSFEGDDCGSWGHRFDGNGGYKKLKGIITFVELE